MIEELNEGSLKRWMCKFCFRNFFTRNRRDEGWKDGISSFARTEIEGESGKRVCLICR